MWLVGFYAKKTSNNIGFSYYHFYIGVWRFSAVVFVGIICIFPSLLVYLLLSKNSFTYKKKSSPEFVFITVRKTVIRLGLYVKQTSNNIDFSYYHFYIGVWRFPAVVFVDIIYNYPSLLAYLLLSKNSFTYK